MAVASENAVFGIPEIKLGIFPLTILPVVRPVIGDRRTMDLALTGRSLDAGEALSLGLVSKVVAKEELQDEALRLATQIGGYSPLALKLGIEAMQMSSDMGFDEAVDYLNAMRTIFFASEDLSEGSRAFLEKRKPVWKGK
jgi:methylglutaconyl-CoA hydratase